MEGHILHTRARELALEMPFSEPSWPFGPEYDVFLIGGKIFMINLWVRGEPVVNLKSDPQKSLLNQAIYPNIKPGYHMNKKHWISIYPGDDIHDDLLEELITDSWECVVDKLPKREQKRFRPG
jgi:Uncharacterized protein conserved in bacteria